MGQFSTFQSCYSGMTADGKMILTPEFAAALRRFDESQGKVWSRACDSAPAKDFETVPEEDDSALRDRETARDRRYAALQAQYDGCRGRAGFRLQDEPPAIEDVQKAADRTREWGLEQIDTVERFKRSRGLDAWPIRTVIKYLGFERAMAEIRRRARQEAN